MLNMRGRNQPPSTPSLEAYAGAVEQILPGVGIDPLAARMNIEGGYGWSFQRGSAVIEVYISLQDGAGYLQVLPLYRRLLELNLQLTAAAIGVHLDVVYVFSERPLDGMDAAEANTIINLVSAYADDLDDKLVTEFGGRLYAKVNG
jgi:hypothetical protein